MIFENEKQANDFIEGFGKEVLAKSLKEQEAEKEILEGQFNIKSKVRKEAYDKILAECKDWVDALDAQIKVFEDHVTCRESIIYQLYSQLFIPFDPDNTDSRQTMFYALKSHTKFSRFLRNVINDFALAVAKAGYYLPGEEPPEEEDEKEDPDTGEELLSTMKKLVELLAKRN